MSADTARPTVEITKPPIPLVWIDTWGVSNMAKARTGEITGTAADPFLRLEVELIRLRDQVAVICPEAGQAAELQMRGPSSKETLRLLTGIRGGVHTHYQHAIDQQFHAAMRAYATNASSVTYDWQQLFMEDPIAELNRLRHGQSFFVRVDLGYESQVEELLEVKAKLQPKLEEIRLANLQARPKRTFADQLDRERRGLAQSAIEGMTGLIGKRFQGEPQTVDDYLGALSIFGMRMTALAGYLKESTGRDAGFEDLLKFYGSPYADSVPSFRVMTHLFARRLIGSVPIRSGDAMDINYAGAILPFATFALVDNDMRDTINRCEFDHEYGVQPPRLSQLLAELQELGS